MDNVENSVQFAAIIADSLWSGVVNSERVLARLYLISDLLHNSTLMSATHCFWTYRKYFELLLPSSLEKMGDSLKSIDASDSDRFVRRFSEIIEVC